MPDLRSPRDLTGQIEEINSDESDEKHLSRSNVSENFGTSQNKESSSQISVAHLERKSRSRKIRSSEKGSNPKINLAAIIDHEDEERSVSLEEIKEIGSTRK